MEFLTDSNNVDEDFIIFFTRLTFLEFRHEFNDDGFCQKKLRNDYDNRLKGKNLVVYYYFYENKKLKKMNFAQQKIIKQHTKKIGLYQSVGLCDDCLETADKVFGKCN